MEGGRGKSGKREGGARLERREEERGGNKRTKGRAGGEEHLVTLQDGAPLP
jgi:hypothetical protein